MSRTRILKIAISLLLLSSLISCVGGGQAAVNETWSLVKLVSKGDPIDNVVPETIEVRNCVVPETKTTDCSAGTSNSLSVDFGGGVEFGEGISGSIDSSVSSNLGIGRQSGQSISLDVPPSGYIYTYEVEKRFSVISGEAVAHSNNDKEQTVSYVFNASCSITIISREQVNCSNTVQNPGGDSGGSPPNQTSSTAQIQVQPEIAKTEQPTTQIEHITLPRQVSEGLPAIPTWKQNLDVWSNAESVKVEGGCAELWRDLTWNNGTRDYLKVCNEQKNLEEGWSYQVKEVEVDCASNNSVIVTLWADPNFSGGYWQHTFCSN